MMDYNQETKSVRQRLGSKPKSSIFSRIGQSNKTGGAGGISRSLKNRLNQRQSVSNESTHLKRLNSEQRVKNDFTQNRLLFKRAIEDSTSFDKSSRSSAVFKPKKDREIEDEPVNFRIANGTIVKGLRSDSILLKKKIHENTMAREEKRSSQYINYNRSNSSINKYPNSRLRDNIRSLQKAKGSVKVSMNRGLTVNIKNEQRSRPYQDYFLPKRTFKNDLISSDDYMSDDSLPITKTIPPLKMKYRKIDMQSYLPPVMSKVVVMQPEPVPQIKLHKQTLDPGVQSEIAVLQGKLATEDSGPGPGVKSFKMIPVITKKPLTDRFKEVRNE